MIAAAAKFAGAVLINESWENRIAVGLAMIPRGEVGLVFAELGRMSGVFNNDVYAGMIIVIVLTTMLPPFVIKWFHAYYLNNHSSKN